MQHKKLVPFLLFCILSLGFFLRTYNVNWDGGYHLHPDERAIVLYALPLTLPLSVADFLSTDSPLNPHFFAYGSLPIYALKGISVLTQNTYLQGYDGITILGRYLSALADTVTIFLIFLIGRKLKNSALGLLGAFAYCISVLPVQLSHFYAVDIPLTCLMTATIFLLLRWYERPTPLRAILIGIVFGAALATKTSAIALVAAMSMTLSADFLLVFIKRPHRIETWSPYAKKFIKSLFTDGLLMVFFTGITFIVCEPYALIDFKTFWAQTLEQSAMTYNPFIFPYTLQYVHIIPYFYEAKQIFLWGLGPVMGILLMFGLLSFIRVVWHKEKQFHWAQELIVAVFIISYFLVVGKFAVGWIRYMAPLYPFFALLIGYILTDIAKILHKEKFIISIPTTILFLSSMLLWLITFFAIYTRPHTRVTATQWIYTNIPHGTTIAVEHWDDSLPLGDNSMYTTQTLKLYDPESTQKWTEINAQVAQSSYIILASNRLYVPLQKLTKCDNVPAYRCYPTTAEYYHKLFSGELGFHEVAEFSSYPTIPVLNIPIYDQSADESFTVYDHPKVMIFKRF